MGGRRLKSKLFNRYVIVGISEKFGHNHADLQSVTPALAHDRSVNYSMALRPKRRGFKLEKNSRKRCDRLEKKTSLLLHFAASMSLQRHLFIKLLYLTITPWLTPRQVQPVPIVVPHSPGVRLGTVQAPLVSVSPALLVLYIFSLSCCPPIVPSIAGSCILARLTPSTIRRGAGGRGLLLGTRMALRRHIKKKQEALSL